MRQVDNFVRLSDAVDAVVDKCWLEAKQPSPSITRTRFMVAYEQVKRNPGRNRRGKTLLTGISKRILSGYVLIPMK